VCSGPRALPAAVQAISTARKTATRAPCELAGNLINGCSTILSSRRGDDSGPKDHENIRALKWRDPQTHEQGQCTVAELVDLIRAHTLVYVSDDAFERTALVKVVDANPPYLRSWARGQWGNDLLTLPSFDS
jgi:hypothetical protein